MILVEKINSNKPDIISKTSEFQIAHDEKTRFYILARTVEDNDILFGVVSYKYFVYLMHEDSGEGLLLDYNEDLNSEKECVATIDSNLKNRIIPNIKYFISKLKVEE